MSAVDRLASGYEPEFDLDYEVGRQGELWVANIADALAGDRAEVKTDERAKQTGNVYLEYECLYRGEWLRTGIATTPSEVWVQVIGEVVIAAPTTRVQSAARHYWRKHEWHRKELTRGSHPTRGVVIAVPDYVRSLIDGVPDGDEQTLWTVNGGTA